MSQQTTSNRRGRVPGSKNKSHKQPQFSRPGLNKEEETRLQQYQEAVKNVRFLDGARGTVIDCLKLVF